MNWRKIHNKLLAKVALPRLGTDSGREQIGGVYIICKPNPLTGWDGIEIDIAKSFRRSITDQVSDLIRRFPEATHVALIPCDYAMAVDAMRDLRL